MSDQSPELTVASLSADLRALGLHEGHQVLVHSSLSSLGRVDGGAKTVIRALLDVVGDDGTLLVPTLTGDETVGPDADVLFDSATSPGWTGVIPETARTWPGALRSLHATHSVAAIGAAAERLTRGHENTLTPCGPGSPYALLADDADGRILLLGVDHESNTTLHAVEEAAHVDYHLQPRPSRAVITSPHGVLERTFWAHQYGTPRDFAAIEPLLLERGVQTTGRVGMAAARLMGAAELMSIGTELLAIDAEFFVER